MPRSLAQEWKELSEKIGLPTVSQVQQREMRRAFYCGALSFQYLMMSQMEEGTNEPTEADMDLMSSINDELEAFMGEMMTEAAWSLMQRYYKSHG